MQRKGSLCQASANSILKISGRCGPQRGSGIAQRGRSLISTIASFVYLLSVCMIAGISQKSNVHIPLINFLYVCNYRGVRPPSSCIQPAILSSMLTLGATAGPPSSFSLIPTLVLPAAKVDSSTPNFTRR